MDIQTILVIVLFVLTINLLIVGVYIILVLKELRHTLKKANGILDSVGLISSLVHNPVVTLTSLITHLIKGFKSTKPVKSLVDYPDKDED